MQTKSEFPWHVHATIGGIVLLFLLLAGAVKFMHDTSPQWEPPKPVTKTVMARMSEPSWRGMRWYVVAEDGTYASVPAARWRVAKKGTTISAHWSAE